MFGHHHHHQHCGPIHVPGCNQTQVCPPVCHEPIQFVKENCYTVVVPHVHPVKTLEVNNVLYKNEHTYPHSYQSMNNVQNQDIQLRSTNGSCTRIWRTNGWRSRTIPRSRYGIWRRIRDQAAAAKG